MRISSFTLFFFLFSLFTFGQEKEENQIVEVNPRPSLSSDVLMQQSPIRASLYSAVLPGAGQLYNKKWWKAPIVWALLGTGIGVISYYNGEYNTFRGAYLDKLNGVESKYTFLSTEQLANLQDDKKRIRDYAIAFTVLAYVLNIVDATVDAHLYGVDKDVDLSFQPTVIHNYYSFQPAIGFTLNLKF